MSDTETLVLPEKYAKKMKPLFKSREEFLKIRDKLLAQNQPKIEELIEKRRKSEENAQVKRYR